MINRECFICKQYMEDVVTIRIFDDRQSIEYSCHEKCANDLWDKLQKVKNIDTKPVAKVIKELKL